MATKKPTPAVIAPLEAITVLQAPEVILIETTPEVEPEDNLPGIALPGYPGLRFIQ